MQKQQNLLPPYLQVLNLTTPLSQLNTKKESHKQQKHMQCREYKNGMYYGRYNSKSNMEGIGIIIYDDANIIIAEFKNGNIHGHFCCFVYDDQMCIYGRYVEGKMEGFGGIYLRGGDGIGFVFLDGAATGQWIFRNGAFVGKHTSLYQPKQIKNNPDILFPKSPPSPTSYIQSYLNPTFQIPNNPSSSSSSQLIISESTQTTAQYENRLKLFEISDHQLYYGTSQDNKPNGIGIIFISEWPVCYGQFYMGQLQGLGRIQQTQFMVLDGVFQDSKIKVGWVVNKSQGFIAFGHAGQNENDKNIFKIKQEYKGIQKQQIQKFRRRIHIQSLQFINSHISPFPQHIKQALPPQHITIHRNLNNISFQPSPKAHKSKAQRVQKSRTAENIKQDNFIPSFISEISRSNPYSPRSYIYHDKEKGDASMRVQKELIDLIKEYNQSRSVYERNSKMVSSKVKENERKDEIQLMQQVVRSRSKSIPKPLPVSQQKSQKSGKIQNISRMPLSRAQIKRARPSQSRVQQSARKTERRLNLQEVYKKYLRKQQ